MEKRVVLAMVLSVALLMGYTALQAALAPPPRPGPVAAGGTGAPVTGTRGADAGQIPTAVPANTGAVAVPDGDAAPAPDAPDAEEEIRTERLSLTVDSAGAALSRADAWGCTYHAPGEADVDGDPQRVTDHFEGRPGFGAVELLGTDVRAAKRNWALARTADGTGVVATLDVPEQGVRLTKTYTPSTDPAAPYHVLLTIEAEGLPASTLTLRQTTLEVTGPWYVHPPLPQAEDGVLVAREGESVEHESPENIREWLEEAPDYEQTAPEGLRWIGARSDFHFGAVEPVEPLPPGTAVSFHGATRRDGDSGAMLQSAAATLRVPFTLPEAGRRESRTFRLYIGPNSRPLIEGEGSAYASFEGAPADRRFLGIGFGPIERLLAWLLQVIASTGVGYGFAVVLLTVLVRGALFPLSRKSQVSMRIHAKKMSEIKPKLDAIKKKYKDPKKQQEMTMKLMREEKVSPLPGGCLLAFVQMPIWISLYGVLQTTFEMRHAGFLWFDDLTSADHLMELPFTRGWWVIDGWFNLLPILMMITWGISARMSPLPEDPQQRQTAKMMRWMPMMFGLFLYQYPSGLALYMTCSALWSICEVQLIRRVWLRKLGLDT